MKLRFPSRPLNIETLLFIPFDLEEASMAICLYKIYHPICISLFFIAVIEYTEIRRQLWRERVYFALKFETFLP